MMLASGNFQPPKINEFFPKEVILPGTIFAIDRITFIRLVFAGLLLVALVGSALRAKRVPGKFQSIVEMMIDFVRKNIGEEILGKENAKKYLPLLSVFFFLIFILNITSVIPGANISSNGRISMPLLLSIVAYIAFIIVGLKRHGLKYFQKSVVVSGLGSKLKYMNILLIPIEFFSTFILRPVTLTIRLMANMLAGHMLLALFIAGTQAYLTAVNPMTVVGIGSFFFTIIFTLFEILVAFLQAYIFALLVAVYIDGSIHAGEH